MSVKKNRHRNHIFQGKINEALHSYVGNDSLSLAGEFWNCDAIVTAVENAENALKSLCVLQKHIPENFHPLIRFAQPNHTWYLNVEKGIYKTQLNMLIDDLLIRIARDIGFAPRLRIMVQPSHQQWRQSGFVIQPPEKKIIQLPNKADADNFLESFIKKVN